MPTILVTNDDGIYAPGLLPLAKELRKIGEVVVLAPERNWSASSHAITIHEPLRVNETTLPTAVPRIAAAAAPPIVWPWRLVAFLASNRISSSAVSMPAIT